MKLLSILLLFACFTASADLYLQSPGDSVRGTIANGRGSTLSNTNKSLTTATVKASRWNDTSAESICYNPADPKEARVHAKQYAHFEQQQALVKVLVASGLQQNESYLSLQAKIKDSRHPFCEIVTEDLVANALYTYAREQGYDDQLMDFENQFQAKHPKRKDRWAERYGWTRSIKNQYLHQFYNMITRENKIMKANHNRHQSSSGLFDTMMPRGLQDLETSAEGLL